ncbi:MAG: hypothetical protein WC959_07540 [Kiritimatiellales bacterium]
MSVEAILSLLGLLFTGFGTVGVYLLSGIRSDMRDFWAEHRRLEERVNEHITNTKIHKE